MPVGIRDMPSKDLLYWYTAVPHILVEQEQADSAKKFVDKSDKKFNEILFQKTKIDKKTYRLKAPKDWFLDDEECLKYGLVDKIVEDLDEIL